MAEISLDGRTMRSPDDFYAQFFAATRGLLPDYGGRNLDALHDDLRDLTEPLTVIWRESDAAKQQLGDWFNRCLDVLREREEWQPVTVLLR
jgi:RNAse (barnase) inhibitor barstar